MVACSCTGSVMIYAILNQFASWYGFGFTDLFHRVFFLPTANASTDFSRWQLKKRQWLHVNFRLFVCFLERSLQKLQLKLLLEAFKKKALIKTLMCEGYSHFKFNEISLKNNSHDVVNLQQAEIIKKIVKQFAMHFIRIIPRAIYQISVVTSLSCQWMLRF